MNNLILVAVALFPAIALCIYVFKKDRVEKEPLSLLLMLLLFGALTCFPAGILEYIVDKILGGIFAIAAFSDVGSDNLNNIGRIMEIFIRNIFGVAIIEEGVKLVAIIWITRKSREFNSLFDGLIYSIFVSLGFAALENVLYVLGNGIYVGITRAVMSVPGHMFFAVMMGYHYSLWHIIEKAQEVEYSFKKEGIITRNLPPFSAKKEVVKCLLVPTLAHGFYNTCCLIGTTWSVVVLYTFLIFMYVHCFSRIMRMSKYDDFDNVYVGHVLFKKYPELLNRN